MSRVDENLIWHGTMGAVDEQEFLLNSSSSNAYFGDSNMMILHPAPILSM
ncbi:MAG: hypothetical protein ACLU6Y_13650 [Ruminococcus sp.]